MLDAVNKYRAFYYTLIMEKYTLSDIINDAKNSCDVLNELAKMVKEQHEVKITDSIHKLVLRKMEQILPQMNLKYENGILTKK